jgi:hypothetical protein
MFEEAGRTGDQNQKQAGVIPFDLWQHRRGVVEEARWEQDRQNGEAET